MLVNSLIPGLQSDSAGVAAASALGLLLYTGLVSCWVGRAGGAAGIGEVRGCGCVCVGGGGLGQPHPPTFSVVW